MKILSWNLNGIRAIASKGYFNAVLKANADIICLQEIKADLSQFPDDMKEIKGYDLHVNSAAKKGYSGVAVYSRIKPRKEEHILNIKRFDDEGRFIRLDFEKFILIDFYIPNGGRDKRDMEYKLQVYDRLLEYFKTLENKKVLMVGDFNIAHEEIDLARPKENAKNTMFTPEEREKIQNIIDSGFTDTFRKFHKEGGSYSWWPYWANARERNLGWRIDYAFASKSMMKYVKSSFILNEIKGSDHCPVGVEIDLE